jgi:hypothetical protein
VQAVIQNTSIGPAPSAIQVNVFLGTVQRVGGDAGVIQPGECRVISTDTATAFDPMPSGTKAQVEVCSPLDGAGDPKLSTSCLESDSDRFIAFRASIGDVRNSNLTDCILSPILDACRSPTTFFLEQPRESVDAVMNVLSGQNPGNQPIAQLRVELYLNSQNVANTVGSQAVVSADL